MADKTYKMVVTLSNGSTVDAGTFVAPQGPQGVKGDTGAQGPQGPQGPEGPQGPSGVLSDWQNATPETVLEDGLYIINYQGIAGIANIVEGTCGGITLQSYIMETALQVTSATIENGKLTSVGQLSIVTINDKLVLGLQPITVGNYQYIKMK